MPRVLVTDDIAEEGIQRLAQGAEVDVRLNPKPAELLGFIGDYDALVVRSQTQVTKEIIAAGSRLQVIGRAGVGVDNIDVEAASQRGIVVVNAPAGNTIAAAEHTIAMMLALARHIPQAEASLRAGQWQRNKFMGIEVRGKILGIIGLGRVGSEVARRAIGLEMEVIAYDPFVPAEYARNLSVALVDLEQLLRQADFVSLHPPLTPSTRRLIGDKELGLMKPTARLINCARGELIDEGALYRALEEGRLAGAALDVFSKEPAVENILLKNSKVVATPHLGASTREAQLRVALDVADEVLAVLQGRPVRYAVNLPFVPPEALRLLVPYISLAQRMGELYTQLVSGRLGAVEVSYFGGIAKHDTTLLTAAVIKGLLSPISEEPITPVNAALVARERGLHITERKDIEPAETYTDLIELQITGARPENLWGTVVHEVPHIVRIGPYHVDIASTNGYLLFSYHRDQPGMIGRVGTILGVHDINISFMQVGREAPRGAALTVLSLDDQPSPEVLAELRAIPGLNTATVVKL